MCVCLLPPTYRSRYDSPLLSDVLDLYYWFMVIHCFGGQH